MDYIWVAYDRNPPNLPIAVASSVAELSRITGYTKNNIQSFWSHYTHGRIKTSPFHKVDIEEARSDD